MTVARCGVWLVVVALALSFAAAAPPPRLWDERAVTVFPSHDEAAFDLTKLDKFLDAGKTLFATRFNRLDGAGRPAATGDSKPTLRMAIDRPMDRLAGPDAGSCAGCHMQPAQGGAGGPEVNVFQGAHFTDPPTKSVDAAITNERNTTSVFGAGAIEMVAREMTEDLHRIRDHALAQAAQTSKRQRVALTTKGVSFGWLVALPDGTHEQRELEGIDGDLIVKPFGVKGVAVSLREFTNFALNHHHGIQPVERFGWARTLSNDFDEDGVENELSLGQVSALAVYQANLPPPVRVAPSDPARRKAVERGEQTFARIGCEQCHRARLPLNTRTFSEPNPYNRAGTAVPSDVSGSIALPLKIQARSGVYEDAGRIYVAAFTDLKRHRICDREDPHFCNERKPQDFVPTDQFLTTKLWDAGTSGPYGHRGDLSTISEAILHHGGEARASKLAFLKLTDDSKKDVVAFLHSLQVVDDGTATKGAKP